MQIDKSRLAGRRSVFSDYLPVDGGEQDRVEALSPIARMDPDLRQALVLEMLMRRMERLENIHEQTVQPRQQVQKKESQASMQSWFGTPVSEQNTLPETKPDIKTAAETYRRIGEL